MSLSAQGTHIYFVDELGALHTLFCPTGVTIPRATKENIDVTCLSDQDRKFKAGMGTPPTLTITAFFDPQQASHKYLWDAQESRENLVFIVGASDGTAAPTVDTAGDVTLPTTRSFFTFEGYIQDTPLDAQLGAEYSIQFIVQMSGNSTLVPKTT